MLLLVLSVGASSDVCEDRHSCLALELEAWFKTLAEQKQAPPCDSVDDKDEEKPAGNNEHLQVFRYAKSCDEENSIWYYKYSGGKGKGRMPKGKGKLTLAVVCKGAFSRAFQFFTRGSLVKSHYFFHYSCHFHVPPRKHHSLNFYELLKQQVFLKKKGEVPFLQTFHSMRLPAYDLSLLQQDHHRRNA